MGRRIRRNAGCRTEFRFELDDLAYLWGRSIYFYAPSVGTIDARH